MARKINIYLTSTSGESSSSNHHPPYLCKRHVLLLDRRLFGFTLWKYLFSYCYLIIESATCNSDE
jgi:hypothetical protein